MQLEETLADLGEEDELVIRDYIEPLDDRRVEEARALLAKAAAEDLMEPAFVLRVLGYSIGTSPETVVPTRGFRILHKIPRLPMPVIENLIQSFGRLREIMDASTEALDEVEGIGEARAKGIKEGLRRLREETILQRK